MTQKNRRKVKFLAISVDYVTASSAGVADFAGAAPTWDGGVTALALTADGATVWQRTLH